MIQHIYNLFQEYSTLNSPDLSPGSTQLDTNRTNRTRSSGGKYESALFLVPAINETQVQNAPLSIKNVQNAFPMMTLGYVFTYYDCKMIFKSYFHTAFSKLNYDVLFIPHRLSLSLIGE